VTFVAITPPPESYSGDRTSFIGRNRSLAQPVAMELPRLSERIGAGLDPCAALRVTVELAPGERRDIVCLLGQAESSIRARELVVGFQHDHALEEALARTTAWWDDLLGMVEVHTPERSADLLINRWLRYQSLS
jgi:cyclic beta-1,2-glucan synthetase